MQRNSFIIVLILLFQINRNMINLNFSKKLAILSKQQFYIYVQHFQTVLTNIILMNKTKLIVWMIIVCFFFNWQRWAYPVNYCNEAYW